MAITSVNLFVLAYLRNSPTTKGQCAAKESLGAPKDGILFLEASAPHGGRAQALGMEETGRHNPEGRFPGRGDFHDHGVMTHLRRYMWTAIKGKQKPRVQ